MVSKKALMIGFVGLVFVAGGTASVLESFGTISGTADIRPALKVSEIDAQLASDVSAEKIEVYNPSSAAIDFTNYKVSDGGDNHTFTALNGSDISSQGYAVLVPEGYSGEYKQDVQYFEADSAFSLDNDGDSVGIWVDSDGFKIDYIEYSDSCSDTSENLVRQSLTGSNFICESSNLGSGDFQ